MPKDAVAETYETITERNFFIKTTPDRNKTAPFIGRKSGEIDRNQWKRAIKSSHRWS